jgi:putative membrane protein
VFLGALLTMFLDVLIDPVATMGELWFLGKIHYYVYPGWYFGVPLSNFAGWFLVSLIIILFNFVSWRFFPKRFAGQKTSLVVGRKSVLFPLFYLGIALFNILVTLWIRQWNLGVFSILILMTLLLTLSFLRVNVRQKKETWVPRQQQS